MEKRLNLIEKLQKKENFTSAESSLADYILNNIDDVYRMSLQDLAKASYVSKPSVIRLYRKVGCLNYREFSIGLQLEKIRNDDGTIENSRVFLETEDLFEFLQKTGILCKQVIDNCISAIDQDVLNDIVTTLNEVDKIYLYSLDGMEDKLNFFLDRMNLVGKEPILIRNSEDPKLLIRSMNEKDAILLTSASERDKEDALLEEIFERPCPRILVSTADDSDLDLRTDYSFYRYPKGSDFIRNSKIVSQVSLLLGLNFLQASLLKVQFDQKEK
ncbi:MAG: hypothetical protein K5648_10365 [Erysipelotrichaceae bacterium]|nr:hypothetical protein [Erysipelotrichaceae bacterium]